MERDEHTTKNRPTKIERKPSVLERTGLSHSALHREIAAGRFPRPRRLTERTSGWLSDEVDAWIRSRPVAGEDEDRGAAA